MYFLIFNCIKLKILDEKIKPNIALDSQSKTPMHFDFFFYIQFFIKLNS